MENYPFDTQTCKMEFVMKGNAANFSKLFPGALRYSGPIDLTQYHVQRAELTDIECQGMEGLNIEIAFGRKILSELLTTHVPTLLIVLVSFSTDYYTHILFKAQVSVNLTCMLVLTTLFISVSGTLPKTSYIKMIDIWLIVGLSIPFIECILHTVVYALHLKDPDNHERSKSAWMKKKHNEDKKEKIARKIDYSTKIIIPITYGVFVLAYFLIGYVKTMNSTTSEWLISERTGINGTCH